MPIRLGPQLIDAPDIGDQPTRLYLGDTGIVLGGDADHDGVSWTFAGAGARGPKPAPRESTGDRDNADGQWDATRFYGPRLRDDINGLAHAPDHVGLHRAEQRLRNAVGMAAMRVRVTEPGFDCWAQFRQSGQVLWSEVNHRTATWSISLFAADPWWHFTASQDYTLSFPVITGGLVLPVELPLLIDAEGSIGGATTLVNPGGVDAPLRIRVTGPAADVTLSQPELGHSLTVSNPLGDTVPAGSVLDIDTGLHQVRLNGATRRSWMTGTWLTAPVGSSTLQAGSSAAGQTAKVAVSFEGLLL